MHVIKCTRPNGESLGMRIIESTITYSTKSIGGRAGLLYHVSNVNVNREGEGHFAHTFFVLSNEHILQEKASNLVPLFVYLVRHSWDKMNQDFPSVFCCKLISGLSGMINCQLENFNTLQYTVHPSPYWPHSPSWFLRNLPIDVVGSSYYFKLVVDMLGIIPYYIVY